MKLVFENSKGEEREIATVGTLDQAYEQITKFCEEHNFTIPYWRVQENEDGNLWFDVGSHSEFFILRSD